ncbi:MAG TPA: NAD(P)-dependent alcohol dehydrogenase [Phototrophicaceae bacterium]|nr:NAD(P)-dependent alcohol dehydrogenase [Phototrophicaceae bacterium]
MKAMVYTEYGPPEVLQIKEVEKPTPKDHEVLVKVQAASVNFSTLHLVTGKPFVVRTMGGGLQKPSHPIPGNDIAGRVEAVGKNVRQFRPGDEVFGDLADYGFGAFAEYVAVPETALALKPANLSFEEAAAVPEAGLVALQGLRDKGHIQPAQKVLICGASGGIGTFAVQLAHHFGADVTAVCSARNFDLVRSLGAKQVIDYTQEDFAQNNPRYDLILATAGDRSLFDYRRALSPKGIYVVTGGSMSQLFQAMLLGPFVSLIGSKKLGILSVKPNQDLVLMKDLLEAEKVKPVLDRCYPFSAIPEALRYYGEGHARGKVVIAVGG